MDELLTKSSKPNAWSNAFCELCQRETLWYRSREDRTEQGHCTNHSLWNGRKHAVPSVVQGASLLGQRIQQAREGLTPIELDRANKLDRKLWDKAKIPAYGAPMVAANDVLCVGCIRVIPKMDCYYGKLWKTLSWKESEKPRLVWNPDTDETSYVLETKRIPIDGYAKGFICRECASDHTVIGDKPRVVLEASPTQSETLNGGDERIERERISHPVDRYGFLIKTPPAVHPASYDKFGRRLKRGK